MIGNAPDRLFIIRNEQVHPEWKKIKPQLKYIAIRSIDTLLKSQGVGDLFRLYAYAQRDNYGYNLAYIPADFTAKPTSTFDTAYMNQLFQLGYNLASAAATRGENIRRALSLTGEVRTPAPWGSRWSRQRLHLDAIRLNKDLQPAPHGPTSRGAPPGEKLRAGGCTDINNPPDYA